MNGIMELFDPEKLSHHFRGAADDAKGFLDQWGHRLVANLEAIRDAVDTDEPQHTRAPLARFDGNGTFLAYTVRPGARGEIRHIAAYGNAAGRIELYLDDPSDPGNLLFVLTLDGQGRFASPVQLPIPLLQNRKVSAVSTGMAASQCGVRLTVALQEDVADQERRRQITDGQRAGTT